ncbi:ATP-binding protein [Wukongibacter sp. M2B1]|uniref:ATP-binding protein n=1 Tax=Wukongibacter sp. M2B1 TaxID=3088895 RepID=UPI003D7947BA
MKRKLVIILLLIVCMTFYFLNRYFKIEYNISLIEYLGHSQNFTEEEQETIKSFEPLIFGADINSPPLRYVNPIDGQYEGMVVDYIHALSIELEADIIVKPLVWQEALNALERGETTFCDMFPSEDRGKKYLFSDPIYNLRGIVLTLASNNSINSLNDLSNKTIAVPRGDYAVERLSRDYKNVNFILTKDSKEAIEILASGKCDLVVGDEPVVNYFVKELKLSDKFKILDDAVYDFGCVLAVPKTHSDLINPLNKAILNLNKRKIFKKIQQKWFGFEKSFEDDRSKDKMILTINMSIVFLICLGYIFFLWNNELKKQVSLRTQELFMSKQELQTTFNSIPYKLMTLDKNLNILSINEQFFKPSCKELENITGKSFDDILLFDEKDSTNAQVPIKNMILKTFEDGKEQREEIEIHGKIYVIAAIPVKFNSSYVVKTILMIRDITKIKLAEMEITHANKMSSMGTLAAGVAHEIRNPLGLIRNYCYLLKSNIDMKDEENKEAIFIIEDSVKRSSDIIDNLLRSSRKTSSYFEKINISYFINQLLKLNKKRMNERNINYQLFCPKNLYVYINSESLRHILMNIISNSIDSMNNGGILSISCESSNSELIIKCEDTGSGISQKDLNCIFDPFFTTKKPGKGTGLGLYIVYNETTKLGGLIKAESQLGKGTTMTLTIPLRSEKDAYS